MVQLSDTVLFDDEVHILVASAGEVDQNGAVAHGLGELHPVSDGVGAFDRGNDALETGELEERVDGVFVVDQVIFDPADVPEERVLGT